MLAWQPFDVVRYIFCIYSYTVIQLYMSSNIHIYQARRQEGFIILFMHGIQIIDERTVAIWCNDV